MTTAVPETKPPSNGHGGYRPGSGRPRKTEQNDAHTLLAKAKAKHESYKAQLAELTYKREIGELMTRQHVEQTTATAYAAVAQSILALPDRLERHAGLTPAQAEIAQQAIHEVLEDLAQRLSDFAEVSP